jgi:hypothetical protein
MACLVFQRHSSISLRCIERGYHGLPGFPASFLDFAALHRARLPWPAWFSSVIPRFRCAASSEATMACLVFQRYSSISLRCIEATNGLSDDRGRIF